MNPDFWVLAGSAVLNTALSLVVLLRNPRKLPNILFAAFGTSIVLWTVFNYFADNAANNNLLYTRLTVLFGSMIGASLVYLSIWFPKKIPTSKMFARIFEGGSVINIILCFTPLYVESVSKLAGGGVELQVGSLFTVYTIYLITTVVITIVNFTKQRRRAERLGKSQIKLFMIGVIVYTTLAIIANVILPLLVDNWASSRYGPAFTVPFVAITSYAIIRHRLFDIRALIARIVAYSLTLSIVVLFYSLILTLVIARVISFYSLSFAQLMVLSIPTILSAFTFSYIKSAVDRFTAKVFYHNSYETREVLSNLSDQLMAENDMEKIMKGSGNVLSGVLNPSSLQMVVLDELEIYKEYSHGTRHNDVKAYVPLLVKNKHQLIVKDDRAGSQLAEMMTTNGHDIILKLATKDKFVGFLCLGDKETRSVYSTQDLELLKVAAKNLSIALENAEKYEQIQHFADTLKDEVNHATTRLWHANQRLKTLDELKDDFISMASHQFRTPAGAIRQALQMLNHPELSDKDRDEILKLAEADSEELVTLVGTMLNISRLQAGRFSIDRSPANLADVANHVMGMTNILAEQKNIAVKFEKAGDFGLVDVDVAKIREAMTNYIENAIKYSPNDSTIKVTLTISDDNKAVFEVSDQGMGVPEDEQSKLFGRFYRARNARKQQPDGNGIGLYVVRKIAEGHDGQSYYRPLEQGSLFGFWIPLHPSKK